MGTNIGDLPGGITRKLNSGCPVDPDTIVTVRFAGLSYQPNGYKTMGNAMVDIATTGPAKMFHWGKDSGLKWEDVQYNHQVAEYVIGGPPEPITTDTLRARNWDAQKTQRQTPSTTRPVSDFMSIGGVPYPDGD